MSHEEQPKLYNGFLRNRNSRQDAMASVPDGTLYVAVSNHSGHGISIYHSIDGWITWTYWTYFRLVPGAETRYPSIAYAEGPGDERWVYVAFEQVNFDDSREVWVRRMDVNLPASTRDAAKIGGPWTMGSASEPIQPRIAIDNIEFGQGYYVYVTYSRLSSGTYPVFFSRSEDRGLTWSTPLNIIGGSASTTWTARPDIAYGKAGLFITYVGPGGTGVAAANKIWVAKGSSFGDSWFPPVQLTSWVPPVNHQTVAAAHDSDSVLVVYSADSAIHWPRSE